MLTGEIDKKRKERWKYEKENANRRSPGNPTQRDGRTTKGDKDRKITVVVAGLEEDGFYESSLEKTSRASGKRELLSGQNNCISMQCCLQIIQESRPNSEPLTNDIPFLKHQTTLQRFDYWTGRH